MAHRAQARTPPALEYAPHGIPTLETQVEAGAASCLAQLAACDVELAALKVALGAKERERSALELALEDAARATAAAAGNASQVRAKFEFQLEQIAEVMMGSMSFLAQHQ